MLPSDPIILLSMVNMTLRDEYPSLESLGEGLDEDYNEIREKLEAAGYKYDPAQNQFK